MTRGPDGRVLTCNKAFCDLVGYSEDELRSMLWDRDLTPSEWREIEAKHLEELRRTGEGKSYRKEYIRKDGSRVPVEVFRQLIRDSEGNIQYYYTFITVLNEPVNVEDEMAELERNEKLTWRSQRAHFTLMGNLPGIVYRCANDRDWTMKWIRGGCFELTGYHASDLIYNRKVSYGQLIHPEDRERVWDVAQVNLKESKPVFQQEYRIITATGAEKWVWEQCRFVPTSYKEWDCEGFITDITERKKAEEQIQTILKEQEELLNEIYNLDLDVITSLLKIQSSYIKDKKKIDIFQESQNCIKTLVYIQQKLYQSKNLKKLDFGNIKLGQEVEFIFDGHEYYYLK